MSLDSSAGLAELFGSVDADGNDHLDLTEAALFYYWVEANIGYRWDDENTTQTQGFPAGDGRPGRDYVQTPLETFNERAGDCEDQNALELAFYAHWKVPAYLAFVNARAAASYDHAIAVVYGAASLEGFRALLGEAPYYEAAGRFGIPDGFYFIVDNTYSNTFGQVSAGISADKFVIHHVASLDSLYGSQWRPGVARRDID